MNQSMNHTDIANDASSAGKQRYATPELVAYGHITALTKGGNVSVTSDSGQNMMRVP